MKKNLIPFVALLATRSCFFLFLTSSPVLGRELGNGASRFRARGHRRTATGGGMSLPIFEGKGGNTSKKGPTISPAPTLTPAPTVTPSPAGTAAPTSVGASTGPPTTLPPTTLPPTDPPTGAPVVPTSPTTTTRSFYPFSLSVQPDDGSPVDNGAVMEVLQDYLFTVLSEPFTTLHAVVLETFEERRRQLQDTNTFSFDGYAEFLSDEANTPTEEKVHDEQRSALNDYSGLSDFARAAGFLWTFVAPSDGGTDAGDTTNGINQENPVAPDDGSDDKNSKAAIYGSVFSVLALLLVVGLFALARKKTPREELKAVEEAVSEELGIEDPTDFEKPPKQLETQTDKALPGDTPKQVASEPTKTNVRVIAAGTSPDPQQADSDSKTSWSGLIALSAMAGKKDTVDMSWKTPSTEKKVESLVPNLGDWEQVQLRSVKKEPPPEPSNHPPAPPATVPSIPSRENRDLNTTDLTADLLEEEDFEDFDMEEGGMIMVDTSMMNDEEGSGSNDKGGEKEGEEEDENNKKSGDDEKNNDKSDS